MRKRGTWLVGAVALFVVLAGLGSGSAAAAGNRKLVEGTVYDTTCAAACTPECPPPPHCGPITAQRASSDIVCAQDQKRIIACPLETTSSKVVCVRAEGCPTSAYPVYSGEGAVVKVRMRGTATVLATLPVVEGHFQIRLGPGEYKMHPYLPEPQCWSGPLMAVSVTAKLKGPAPASLYVSDSCVAHTDSK
ncbi:MAG TPA: hypothetical protein VH299_10670 [Solirubrobacterales bacterium]|jgi:hypothetical protein|nr:hypothetical protein [Solirubrobacterales bacterium]